MLASIYTAALALFAVTAIADGQAIVDGLCKVTNDTMDLNKAVSSFSGDTLGLLPILAPSQR
jgi:hypothetical protein